MHFGDDSNLLPSDTRSGVWNRLEADLRDRLARLREENDSGDAEETARRRGRIAEIKELLAFGVDARAQRSEPDR